ncbi:MAG: hypothetical protein J0I09_13655 [Sphingobacteriia bacterium]|nr:hypothetical protein [Sphingobacteriia bacterium]
MDTTTIVLSSIIAILLAGFLAYIFWIQRRQSVQAENGELSSVSGHPLQLQAYERLILLADRIAIPNLISRLNHPDLSAREMQLLLTQTIKQEFDHNITQQIYVTAESWEAVKNLKEQTLLIINQLANTLAITAKAYDLNKLLLEYLHTVDNMNDKVSALLSFNAKKVL